jgi:hypothetical protein
MRQVHRSFPVRAASRACALLIASALAACGGNAAAPTPASNATTGTPSLPPTAPVATVLPIGTAPVVTVITPPKIVISGPLRELWTYRGAPTSTAWAPVIGPKGRIWVAALSSNTFWVLDRDGKLVETWGTPGSGDGQISIKGDLGQVFGSIAFAPDGGFVVGDGGNRRIQVFDAQRRFVRAFGKFGDGPGQFVTISGVAMTPDGSIVVDDGDRLDVQVFDPSGTPLRTICDEQPRNDASPVTAVDASGTTWCIFDDQLEAFSPTGEHTVTVDLHGVITLGIGIAIAPNGHIFVASVDNNKPPAQAPERLLELDAHGTLLHVWPTGGEGIAIDPAGDRIYITSIDLERVRAYVLPAS